MHQYGRAIDLIVDEDGDNKMDDLNGDGRADIGDARLIQKYVNALDRRYLAEKRMARVGGAGVYSHTDFDERTQYLKFNTPYIHMDTRGYTGAEGRLVRWAEE